MAGLALVTGASSGIGRAFAQRLGAEEYDLLVAGRRRDRLDELVAALPDVQVRPLVADLGTDTGVAAVAEACATEPLTMLINNAGVAYYMPFAELPADQAAELLGGQAGCAREPGDHHRAPGAGSLADRPEHPPARHSGKQVTAERRDVLGSLPDEGDRPDRTGDIL